MSCDRKGRLRDAVEAAYGTIRAGIIEGRYAAGQRLTGDTLAQAAGVSRTPIREALRRLHAEGLVRMVPNQGATVVGWTASEIAQMFGLRAVLESYAAELATPLLTDAQIERIASLAEQTYTLAHDRPADFRQALARANSELHLTIVAGAANERLATMIASVVEMPLVLRTLDVYTPGDLLRSAGHHRELVLAFRAREPQWASAVMRSHILAARRAISQSSHDR